MRWCRSLLHKASARRLQSPSLVSATGSSPCTPCARHVVKILPLIFGSHLVDESIFSWEKSLRTLSQSIRWREVHESNGDDQPDPRCSRSCLFLVCLEPANDYASPGVSQPSQRLIFDTRGESILIHVCVPKSLMCVEVESARERHSVRYRGSLNTVD